MMKGGRGNFMDAYLLTFMFKNIGAQGSRRHQRMEQEVERFYRTIITRIIRHPRSAAARGLEPIFVGCFDRPVPKFKRKVSDISDTVINDGEHVHGIFLVPWESRLQEPLHSHIERNYGVYVRKDSQLRRLDARPLRRTPEKAIGYALKSFRRGWYDSDHLIILPKTPEELSAGIVSTPSHLDRVPGSGVTGGRPLRSPAWAGSVILPVPAG
jgi:hypothetical protein